MSIEPLVIVGAGGFGREVFALVQDLNRVEPRWQVLGFLDDALDKLAGLPYYGGVLGPIESYRELGCPWAICAVGDPRVRKAVVGRLDAMQACWATLGHPTAVRHDTSTIGEGCVLCHGAWVSVDTRIGRHVHMNCMTTVGHDAHLGDFCTLSPHADICGAAVLETGVFLGSHASVLPKAHVGAWARVGGGSVVLRNVAPNTTVFGVPTKQV